MKFEKLAPMLRTWDLPGSVDFYTTVLGFHCDQVNEEPGWACLSRGGVEIMLSRPNQHLAESAAAFSGSLYVRVDDVDALWAQLGDRVRVCYPIETFDYGMREFAIYDNNGYLLQFGTAVDHSAMLTEAR